MTGDYSRSTFKPKAQFDGVLMQQGRVQIDADWNEFVEIVNDRDASRAIDIIGAVGAPRTTGGFEITPILNGADLYDLAISPGVIYVDGVRVATDPTPVPVRIQAGNLSMTVGTWIVDGLPFQVGQQIAVPTMDGSPQILEITGVTLETLTITVGVAIVNPLAKHIVRTTTYLFQPNYRSQPFDDSSYAPTPPPLPQVPEGKGILASLNAWQRVITALDDPEIADPALNGADTAVRSQIVWKVEYDIIDIPPVGVQLTSPEDAAPSLDSYPCSLKPDQTSNIVKFWQDALILEAADRGRMSAHRQSLSASSLKNQLYRVQIHSPGYVKQPISQAATISGYEVTTVQTLDGQPWLVGQTILLTGTPAAGTTAVLAEILNVAMGTTTAILTVDCMPGDVVRAATSWTVQRASTFLWARDNASIAANLASLNGAEIMIDDDGRDTVSGFQGCEWIELVCDSLEGQGAPGIVLQVKEIRGAAITTILDYEELGMPLDMSAGWAVRRWDSPYTGLTGQLPPSVQGALISLGEGVPIEDGISVDFEANTLFSCGDYWWIVSRTNGETIEWPVDAFGPVKKPPVGIERAYAQLAVVYYSSGSWHACDLRPMFGQSIDFVDKTGDVMTGPLEIASGSSAPYSVVTSAPAYLNVGASSGSAPSPILDPDAGLFVSGDMLAFKHENKNSFVGMLAPRLDVDKSVLEAGRIVLAGAGGSPTIIPRLDFSSSLNMSPLIRFEVTNQTAGSPELTLKAPGASNTGDPIITPEVTLFVVGNIYATGDIQGNHPPSNLETDIHSLAGLNALVIEQANQIAELTRRIEQLERAAGA